MVSPGVEWKIPVNGQYQEAMKLLMNLVMAALVLPLVFVRTFVDLDKHETISRHLRPQAYWAWGLLTGSLLFGILFFWASAKYVKAVFGAPEAPLELWFEGVRDAAVIGALLCFGAGAVCLLWFLAACRRKTQSE
jgi:hypothetical protein